MDIDTRSMNLLTDILIEQDQLNIAIAGKKYYEIEDIYFDLSGIAELCEAMGLIGFKWWKSTPALDEERTRQLHGELIDVLHFGMSMIGIEKRRLKVSKFEIQRNDLRSDSTPLRQLEPLGLLKEQIRIMASGRFDIVCFVMLCEQYGLSLDQIYRIYMTKNTLNHFRNANGNKEGNYYQIWGAMEDSDFALNLAETIKPDQFFKQTLVGKLDEYYQRLTQKGVVKKKL